MPLADSGDDVYSHKSGGEEEQNEGQTKPANDLLSRLATRKELPMSPPGGEPPEAIEALFGNRFASFRDKRPNRFHGWPIAEECQAEEEVRS